METPPSPDLRHLTVPEVQARLQIGRSTLYAFLDERSPRFKPDFPKPVHVGRSTRFLDHEVTAYMRHLMTNRTSRRRR